MRFAVIALSTAAVLALLTTGALMNGACKTNGSLGWCAPARTHVSVNFSHQRPSLAH
jgi:hypothetical protein